MSGHWIGIIPRNPYFVPTEEAITRAKAFMEELAPEAEEIVGDTSPTVQFRDCGENFMTVSCPHCGVEISTDWWQEQIDAGEQGNGFDLDPLQLPCGHEAASLNDLRYDWEQGFSLFILDAMNPNIGRLTPEQVARFEAILGCPVKVIYQHL